MNRALAIFAAALLAVSARTARAQAPPRLEPGSFAAEVSAGGVAGTVDDLSLRGWEIRFGVGRDYGVAGLGGRAPDSVDVLVTGGFSRMHTPAGLGADGWRLGLGVRARWDRLFLGGDAEGIRVEVPRVSTSGRLVANGLGARLLGGADLARFGRAALVGTLEVTVDGYGIFASPSWIPAIHLAAGLRL